MRLVWELIISRIPEGQDVASLRMTSKALHTIAGHPQTVARWLVQQRRETALLHAIKTAWPPEHTLLPKPSAVNVLELLGRCKVSCDNVAAAAFGAEEALSHSTGNNAPKWKGGPSNADPALPCKDTAPRLDGRGTSYSGFDDDCGIGPSNTDLASKHNSQIGLVYPPTGKAPPPLTAWNVTNACAAVLSFSGVDMWLSTEPSALRVVDEEGLGPLHWGCQRGDAWLVRELLSSHAVVDLQSTGGTTPLHVACLHGHAAAMEECLYYKADVYHTNSMGDTALHIACQNAPPPLVRSLLARGPEVVNTKNTLHQRTPLHMACVRGDAETIVMLLEAGAHLHPKDALGNSPLHLVCQGRHLHRLEAIEALVAAGAKVDEPDASGCTALHVAVQCQNRSFVPALVAAGASLDARNKQRDTPLVIACRLKNQALINALLSAGAVKPHTEK
eukprot:gene7136-242_t